jgi:uncharacterized membrane protein
MVRTLLKNFDYDSKAFFAFVTFWSCTMLITIALNIHLVRAIVGFFYLTFIPGAILTKLLKIHDLGLLETILFSVGLSLAFIMLFGLLFNFLGPFVGVSNPLSPAYFLIAFVFAVEAIALLSIYVSSKDSAKKMNFALTQEFKMEILMALPFAFLPLLSIIGAIEVNAYENNFILLLMISFTSIAAVIASLYSKAEKHRLYAFAIIMIGLALLFHTSLASKYIYEGDIHMEYHVFRITQNASYWNPTIGSTDLGYNWLNAMLSITIFPTIYSNTLDLEGTWVFKIIVPIIFSFVCLGLYQLYKKEFSSKVAFVSVFFFMANSVFFTEPLGNIRQMLAELFYVLLFLVLLDNRLSGVKRGFLFIFFSFALVVSHYSLSYIFLFIAIGMWFSKHIPKPRYKHKIDERMIVTFAAIMFSWYIYISNSGPFRGLLGTVEWIWEGFVNQFFNLEARGGTVLAGLGLAGMDTFWHILGRGFFYLTELFIVAGFLFLVFKPRNGKVSKEYLTIVALNMLILAACVIVPFLANTLNMTRFYHITLFFLAPLFAVGGLSIMRLVQRNLKTKTCIALLMLVLIPFFLFQTGFVYEITGVFSYSVPLSKYRMDLVPYVQMSVVTDQDVFGARWVLKNLNPSDALIYSDLVSSRALNSYGMVYSDTIQQLTNTTMAKSNGIAYLGWVNSIKGKICNRYDVYYNTTELQALLDSFSRKIYSSGGCEMYRNQ